MNVQRVYLIHQQMNVKIKKMNLKNEVNVTCKNNGVLNTEAQILFVLEFILENILSNISEFQFDSINQNF